MMDAWFDQLTNIKNNKSCALSTNINKTEFEDNFDILLHIERAKGNNKIEYKPLPDSKEYLLGLERKVEKLRNGSKLIDALSEKREDCLRSLLQSTETITGDWLLELDNNLQKKNSDSCVQNFQRFIQPVQPATLGETVEFIKYDQLQQQQSVE